MSLKLYPKLIWISQITGRVSHEKMTGPFWAHYKLIRQTPLSPEQKRRTKRRTVKNILKDIK